MSSSLMAKLIEIVWSPSGAVRMRRTTSWTVRPSVRAISTSVRPSYSGTAGHVASCVRSARSGATGLSRSKYSIMGPLLAV